ncbi:MAG: PRC-barrel domain containing protein [Chloroflexi bacterium]|nr:PRC-barrel domain containing protein [Chloroflexota bacterium]
MIPAIQTIAALTDCGVCNIAGDNLGEIQELVIDPINGTVTYAILSCGGILDLSDKLFAVPWRALQFDPKRCQFVLDVDPDTLRNAPGLEPDHGPQPGDHQWGAGPHDERGQAIV